MRFRLTDEDREQLKCPEWIEFDEKKLRVKEIRSIQEITGIEQDQWGAELERGHLDLMVTFVWLALRRSGVEVPFEDVDFDIAGMQMEGVTDQGKAPTP